MSTAARRHSSSAGSEKPASLHDSARGSPEPSQQPSLDAFHSLVEEINQILGPSNGIDSADVHVQDLVRAMEAYKSEAVEWAPYAFCDAGKEYTRNLVDRGNGKANLLVLVWTPGKRSPVHDHANAHCVMKVLKGSLEETLYGFPCQADAPTATEIPATLSLDTRHQCSARCSSGGAKTSSSSSSSSELPVKRRTIYTQDQVTYMSDRIGLHSVANPSEDPNDYAVSLHLYTPPNAAHTGCHVYNEKTGKKSSQKYKMDHFYSELGVKMQTT